VREARRTLGRWLLAAFLESGGDPWRIRVPLPVPVVRPVSRDELRRIAGPLSPLAVLTPRADRDRPGGEAAAAPGRLLRFPGA
jgi:hypothetical protein